MCGIAVVVHGSQPVAQAAVLRMNDAQRHRGPDGTGVRCLRVGGRTVALGHRRLAIQDLSPAGAQPMENPATGDWIVYNGELYNVAELRSELASGGFVFRSRSDTEVVLAAFARWGIGCLQRLYGMFAFGLYAAQTQRLYFARDPLGIKPLYWAVDEQVLVVGSETRGVCASGLVEPQVDRLGLESLLAYGATAGPRTMLDRVRMLEPGTWAEVDPAAARLTPLSAVRYWEFAAMPRVERSVKLVGRALRPELAASVRSHLVSDVPVAVFLSGGIDSTAVAALASEARAGDIDTFTVHLSEDAAIDEAPIARRTARALGTRHHEVILTEHGALELADKWLASMDQPSVDGFNTYVISRAARERGIVVALSGLGGDELFGGYKTFRQAPVLARILKLGRRMSPSLRARLSSVMGYGSETRAEKACDLLEVDPSVSSVSLWRRRLMSGAQMEALGLQTSKEESFLPPECAVGYGVPANSPWATVRALETRLYMGNTLLRDADVFGMAHGFEIRVPLLDRRVLDVALRYARPELDPRPRPNKPWLVAALDGRIPQELLRRSKRGFSLPLARWMRGPLRASFEARIDSLATSGLVDGKGVRRVWGQFLRDARGPAWSRAWMLAVLGEWVSRARKADTPSLHLAGAAIPA